MTAWGRRKSRVFPFVSISLALHVYLVLMRAIWSELWPTQPPPAPTAEPVEVALVPAPSATNPSARAKQLEQQRKEEEKKELAVQGQVVDLAKPADERRPSNARFLSEYDATAKKETKAPPQPVKAGKVLVDRAAAPKTQPRAPTADPAQRDRAEHKLLKLAMRPSVTPPSAVPLSPLGDEPAAKPPAPDATSIGSDLLQRLHTPDLGDLQLSDQELAEIAGTRANDALSDVEEGEQTLLNSTRWLFASFFNRVKRQVAQNWHPDQVYRRRDPGGNVYGFRDRLTVLRVQLTPDGSLKEVEVDRGSGVGFLDDEAVSAFRLAQPFPNPPKGLVDEKNGLIEFRFGFMFEISRGASFKVFRSMY